MPGDYPTDESQLIRRVHRELIDDYDEELEMERDDWEKLSPDDPLRPLKHDSDPATRNHYFKELFRLQGELVKMHDWVVEKGHRLVIVCEGRDAAGKGGVIKRITQRLNPRVARVAALVFSAVHRAPAGGGRDRALRPELVQPGRRGARHGLLFRRRVRGVLSLGAGVREDAHPIRDAADQVLVLHSRRGAGVSFPL
jgi:hypothetical protein